LGVAERLGKLGCAGKPVGRQLLQRLQNRLFHMPRDRVPLGGERPRGFGDYPGHDRLGRRPRERWVAREHLIQHRPHRVHIAPCGDFPLTHRLLGAHVLWRSQTHPRFGHACGAALGRGQRDTEVGHQRAPIVQQNVLGLDVTVNHALPMGVVQRVGHLAGNANGVVYRELLLAIEQVTQRFALDVGHDVKQKAIGLPRIVQREDMRVLQVGGGLDLGQEPIGPDDGRQLRPQDFERYLAVVLDILGQVHRGHATGAEFALDGIALGEGAGQTFRDVGHGYGLWAVSYGL